MATKKIKKSKLPSFMIVTKLRPDKKTKQTKKRSKK